MLQDKSTITPRGMLTIEAYNDEGTFFRKTKKNLIVETANEIMAQALANPNKKTNVRVKEEGKTATKPVKGAGYPYALKKKEAQRIENGKILFTEDTPGTTFTIGATDVAGDLNVRYSDIRVFKLGSVVEEEEVEEAEEEEGLDGEETPEEKEPTLEEIELVLNKDFFITDEIGGKIEFAEEQTKELRFSCKKFLPKGQRVKVGSIQVKVDGEEYILSTQPSNEDKTFTVDYTAGEIYFETPRIDLEIDYEIEIPYGINFMALGGKPSDQWQDGRTVEFTESDRLKLEMTNEIPGTRVLLDFPDHISEGAPEMDLGIKTIPIAKGQVVDKVTIVPEGDEGAFPKRKYTITNLFDEGMGETARLFLEFIEVKNATKEVFMKDPKVTVNKLDQVEIEFEAGTVEINDVIELKYNLKLDNQHLVYKLGQSPVLKLVSVRHINSLDSTDIREYRIERSGLDRGKGDVWISGSGTGHITFSENPVGVDPSNPAPPVHTPGVLQVEYLVNSGSAVQFTADFPKGTPEETIEEVEHKETLTPGVVSVRVPNDVFIKPDGNAAIEEVLADGQPLAEHEYVLAGDNGTISINAGTPGMEITIKYLKVVSEVSVYQVAMFDSQFNGKMFNISGLGPIPKDKNTGIRVTWTVIF